jgi:hypothetical protein
LDKDVEEWFPGMEAIPDDIIQLFEEEEPTVEPVEDEEFKPEVDEFVSPEAFDQYQTANVLLDHGGEQMLGTVKSQKQDVDGNPVGISNLNPLLDMWEYEVEFPDGSIDVLLANAIAEALYLQVDEQGQTYAILLEIVDHWKDGNTVSADDGFILGTNQWHCTMKGWQLLIEWHDGSMNWVPMSEMKESYPIQVAKYAANNKITSKPVFAWWVPHVLRKHEHIITKV